MNLLHKMQVCSLAFFWSIGRRVADDAIIILDDIFFLLVQGKHACEAVSHLQKKNEYQVINAHKGILA